MSIPEPQISSTLNTPQMPSILIYGPGKIGKTFTTATTSPRPLLINTDRATQGLDTQNIPKVDVDDVRQLPGILEKCRTDWVNDFDTYILDDITEVGEMFVRACHDETIVSEYGKKFKGESIYGELAIFMLDFIHRFRALSILGKFPVAICKEDKYAESNTGLTLFQPEFPGKKIRNRLPHMFSEIYHAEWWEDPQKVKHRVLRTRRNNQINAGSTSGKVGEIEFFNMSVILQKLTGN